MSSSPMAGLMVTTAEMTRVAEIIMERKVTMGGVAIIIIIWIIGIPINGVPGTTR